MFHSMITTQLAAREDAGLYIARSASSDCTTLAQTAAGEEDFLPPVDRLSADPQGLAAAQSILRFLSFGDINLARDAHNWGPLDGYEEMTLDVNALVGKQQPFANGRLGRLYRSTLGKEEVCLKIVRCPLDDEGDEVRMDAVKKELLREVDTLAKVKHPRVVRLVGVAERKEEPPSMWCIAMEYMAGGTLQNAIKQRRGEPFPLPTAISLAADIASGMLHIHSLGLLHRDLKSPNILLDAAQEVAKVADFGTARPLAESSEMTGETGTFRWMAPEMIRGEEYCTKVDVYSFGVILWELLTGQFPWEQSSCVQVAFAVAQKNERPLIPAGLPGFLARLVADCWHADPSHRPEFTEVVHLLNLAKKVLSADPALLRLKYPKKDSAKGRASMWARNNSVPGSEGEKNESPRRRVLVRNWFSRRARKSAISSTAGKSKSGGSSAEFHLRVTSPSLPLA